MSNYKLEVENTEKLNSDISSAFAEINTELKKDDNLIASDLFDVDRCIEKLKGSRLKWASGTAGFTISGGNTGMVTLDIPTLNFTPNLIFCRSQNNDGSLKFGWCPVSDDRNFYVKPQSNGSVWKLSSMTINTNFNYNGDFKNIIVINFNSREDEFVQNLRWYAFE